VSERTGTWISEGPSPSGAVEVEVRPIVAIHQPNFFPWLGYFHKMRWSDVFVLLDDAQIQKTGGSVTNRAELVSNGKRIFFTAPIDRSKGGTMLIHEVRFAEREDFRARLETLLRQAYARAPFMKELGPEILAMVREPAEALGAYNSAAIRRIAQLLGLRAEIVSSSSLGVTTTSTQRLVDIVDKLGGRTYLAGGGAKDYQDDSLFFARGINVWYRDFSAPAYPHGKDEPMAGLSVLDALLYTGVEGTRRLLDVPLDPARLRLARAAGGALAPAPGGA
jgi:hypothetical protein